MRKTKLNPEVQQKICDALRAGNTRRASCTYVGIAEQTFYNWISRGEKPELRKDGQPKKSEEPFIEFLEAVTRAESECEVWHVANIKKQASGDWRASVEWLKRRKRDDWSEKQVTSNTTLNVDYSQLSDEQLLRIRNGESVESVVLPTAGSGRN